MLLYLPRYLLFPHIDENEFTVLSNLKQTRSEAIWVRSCVKTHMHIRLRTGETPLHGYLNIQLAPPLDVGFLLSGTPSPQEAFLKLLLPTLVIRVFPLPQRSTCTQAAAALMDHFLPRIRLEQLLTAVLRPNVQRGRSPGAPPRGVLLAVGRTPKLSLNACLSSDRHWLIPRSTKQSLTFC